MGQPHTLERLASTWAQHVRGALLWLSAASSALLLLVALQVARVGTPGFRALAWAIALAAIFALLARKLMQRRALDRRRMIHNVLRPVAPQTAATALRAINLVERVQIDASGISPELAQLHFDRVIARTDEQAVRAAASRRAGRYTVLAFTMLAAVGVILALGPVRVVEGAGVLLARHGRAPVTVFWLQNASASVRFPRYLHIEDHLVDVAGRINLPAGAELTVRGEQRYTGRNLLLTDGSQEIPFTTDVSGDKVARITLAADVTLSVAARFGEVLIHEPRTLDVVVVPDQSPRVVLEGAPRKVQMADLDQLDLNWRATDDHGLKQIDLVLRTGTREERRPLATLDGDVTDREGASKLTPSDKFLKRAFLPVTVTVEARDTNPDQQASWGKSETIVIVPPPIGDPEARRNALLLDVRSAFVLQLATLKEPQDPKAPPLKPKQQVAALRTAVNAVFEKADSSALPASVQSFITSQIEGLDQAAASNRKLEEKLRLVTLAIDAASRALATRDARKVSVRLGDVAEEVATGAHVGLESEQRARGMQRVDEGLSVLQASVAPLSQLGDLGKDLGEVLRSGTVRIARVRRNDDLFHTELAALHLAARLRRPTPSFSASSNKPHGGRGGESGGGGSSPQSESASQDDEKYEHLAEQLAELVAGHQDNLNEVERALQDALNQAKSDEANQEGKERAEALRRAVQNLPEPGQAQPGSDEATAALARERTGAMAQGIEGQDLQNAVDSARDALSAFEEALRRQNGSSYLQEQLQRGREEVKKQLAWAKAKLAEQQAQAAKEAAEGLKRAGAAEQELARKASELANGDPGEVSLPEAARERLREAQQLMEEAARRLAAGETKEAIELQQQAQRLLEASDDEPNDDQEDQSAQRSHQSGGDRGLALGGAVPGDAQARAEEFRRRVLEGLGKGREGPLAPAVKRYAEGLLQ
ncbi:MAG TPA: DUF4175 family protein [Polyangiaceae bacterium]|nr:DUF4175 family protein [Polyangiaceae bacterium]